MENILKELDNLSTEEVDTMVARFTCTLGRNSLVHLLLDMIDPKVMIQHVLLKREQQEDILRGCRCTGKEVCYECLDIYGKLERELDLVGIKTSELYMEYVR